MAYRRRQGMGRSATFKEETYPPPPHSTSSSLAAQAIMASAAHRDSSHSPAYAHSKGGGPTYDYTSMEGSNEAGSFWGVLARKAKAILDDDNNVPYHPDYPVQPTPPPEPLFSSGLDQARHQKTENPTLRKGLDALTTSMNRIGDSIGNALEEGRTIVENKTADFIEETRKIQIRRKGNNNEGSYDQTQNQTSQEDLLKASRDVAMATAAKAKLLLRELKTVKADLAFAKQRCSQLEEENKILREGREKGVFPADDDMIRLQLETLLAEKARLAHENSIYARENRFLREIVEYHQLTMQDVVYLDEGIEEVTEVYDPVSRMLSPSPSASPSRTSSLSRSSSIAKEMMALSMATARENNNNNNNNNNDASSA
ncbi:hypothetical protein CASFOL_026211 [Castilleja foliolosa]|uniref:Uncharacterized protein n=1 Tax=Castilleja foliolosa TaxID=1961234 RepID=A0ABD3CL06_9LAMI